MTGGRCCLHSSHWLLLESGLTAYRSFYIERLPVDPAARSDSTLLLHDAAHSAVRDVIRLRKRIFTCSRDAVIRAYQRLAM
jgi:hypothetical protein